MQNLRYAPARKVSLEHTQGLPAEQWSDSDLVILADMLEKRFVFVTGCWREWVVYYGDDHDNDHPHVLVIGKALSRRHRQNFEFPETEYIIPHFRYNEDQQWGLQVQHLEGISRLRHLPRWVQEVELCWWSLYHPGIVETPDHIKSRLDVLWKIGPHSKGYDDVREAIDHSKNTFSLATSLGEASFDIQSDVKGQGIRKLKESYLEGMVKSLRLSDEDEKHVIESYRADRDRRSSRHHGFDLLRDPHCLDLIESSIMTADDDSISRRPYGVTFAQVLGQAAREHAPACLARSMSDEELKTWGSDEGLSQYASIVTKDLDRRATDSQSAGLSSSSAHRA
jgi:hypothetical protein